jgi:cell division protein FtsB
MLDKIKSAARVFFHGMTSSLTGLSGAVLVVLSLYLLAGLFTGVANVQNFIKNWNELGKTDSKIAALQQQLDRTNLHIKLLQQHSPDFVSEMALRHLNLGDPKLMIIKK